MAAIRLLLQIRHTARFNVYPGTEEVKTAVVYGGTPLQNDKDLLKDSASVPSAPKSSILPLAKLSHSTRLCQ